MTNPVPRTSLPTSTITTETAPAVKSALAKPREIDPDYDEGMKKTEVSEAPKGRSGVKIADEVEIIKDNPDLQEDYDSDHGADYRSEL